MLVNAWVNALMVQNYVFIVFVYFVLNGLVSNNCIDVERGPAVLWSAQTGGGLPVSSGLYINTVFVRVKSGILLHHYPN